MKKPKKNAAKAALRPDVVHQERAELALQVSQFPTG